MRFKFGEEIHTNEDKEKCVFLEVKFVDADMTIEHNFGVDDFEASDMVKLINKYYHSRNAQYIESFGEDIDIGDYFPILNNGIHEFDDYEVYYYDVNGRKFECELLEDYE